MIAYINKSVNDRRNGVTSDKGFTLIELLVVVIIIGILAAIAIPMFLSQRQGAWESQVESDLKNASIAAESYASAHNGSYSGLTVEAKSTAKTSVFDYGFNKTDRVELEPLVVATAEKYVFTATHKDLADVTWTYDSDSGVITRDPAK